MSLLPENLHKCVLDMMALCADLQRHALCIACTEIAQHYEKIVSCFFDMMVFVQTCKDMHCALHAQKLPNIMKKC